MGSNSATSGQHMTKIKDVAGTYLLGDAGPGNHCKYTITQTDFSSPGTYYKEYCLIHNGGINVGFCDGHAKWLKAETLGAPGGGWTIAAGD